MGGCGCQLPVVIVVALSNEELRDQGIIPSWGSPQTSNELCFSRRGLVGTLLFAHLFGGHGLTGFRTRGRFNLQSLKSYQKGIGECIFC